MLSEMVAVCDNVDVILSDAKLGSTTVIESHVQRGGQ